MHKNTLVLDVGTTGVKAFVFDANLAVAAKAYKRLDKKYPKPGWVEQSPEELLSVSQKTLREAIAASGLPSSSLLALGITNQRETTICWNKSSGKSVYPAIIWEDTRTRKFCSGLKKKYEKLARGKTGLYVDPYFSAPKMGWILKNVPEAKRIAEKKELASGTVDSWLLWNFLEEKPHLTDYTNASRTLLFNIKSLHWDNELLELFGIPLDALPQVFPTQSFFGNLKKNVLGFSLPVRAVCGDQQASMYAAGTENGVTKVTYGTGTFIMQILGANFSLHDSFFTTLVPNSENPIYALETKIGGTGKRIDKLLKTGHNLGPILAKLAEKVNVMIKKLPVKPRVLIVDGGIIRDKRMVSTQAVISKVRVKSQRIFDGTALGVAKLMNS
jgi:glycerol kinase